MATVDFTIEAHGEHVVLTPISGPGRDWFHEHIGSGAWVEIDIEYVDRTLQLLASASMVVCNSRSGLH